ncbi:MAG: hypothetical protein KDA32_04375 [Phycisphaerales bacterium]|nr:hypothetical protein [Phycisphaerales bacterium]
MKFRNRRTLRAARAAAELFDDDGVDPRTAFSRESGRSASEADRKSMQAARVAQRAIEAALVECGDALRADIEVVSVEPLRGAARLNVILRAHQVSDQRFDLSEIQARLSRLRGFLRARVAQDLRRRKAPDIALTVIPAEETP